MFDTWQAHKEEQAAAYAEAVDRLRVERDSLQILLVVEGQGGTLGAGTQPRPDSDS